MGREAAISIYLLFFRLVFNMFKLFPQKEKTVCVASFGDNVFYTTRSLRSISDEDIIFLKTPSCKYPFDPSIGTVIPFAANHPIAYMRSIYHLATATTILVDNYFGFLSVTNFKKDTTCIQLWHAAGAIKKFGLMDPSIKIRTPKAYGRFQTVYNRFHYTVVGSEKMASVFRQSFGLVNESILHTGVPRTDIFFDTTDTQHRIFQYVKRMNPSINDKKVILYAPTFRSNQLTDYKLALDIKQLYQQLSNEYVLFIKLHPAVSYSLDQEYKGFVYDVSNYYDTNHLLLITNLLITDYSSIPFEYALLQKPMIFFAYDKDEYQRSNGLLEDYGNQMPGPIVSTTQEIILAIEQWEFDYTKIKNFAIQWNEYSKGNSSINLARFITGEKEE